VAVAAKLTTDQVLVTIGTPCSMSAVGGTLTTEARIVNAPEFIAHAAFDAGLVDLTGDDDASIQASWPDGSPAPIRDIEKRFGDQLRDSLGIRVVPELFGQADTDIAAALPHDLADGGLRRLAGLTSDDIRGSELRDMRGLFDDDPRLSPSLQAQLFAHTGIGALAALPAPLAELLPQPSDFRVAAATAFPGLDSWGALNNPAKGERPRDTFAARLAGALGSHGPALVQAMLAPAYPLGKTMKNPELLATLESSSGYMRVPQAPLTAVGACASSLIALTDIAPQLMFHHPGFHGPKIVMWTAADTATLPGWEVLDGFGSGALVTTSKLAELNAGRPPEQQRPVSESLAPFDVDACGTVVGDAGSGLLVTTLDFALRNFLDVTSIIAGWGQSGETGGKAHFAGVGFGGENSIIHAFEMAREGHGLGVSDFGYAAAHATGTRTNSKTDLAALASARAVSSRRGGGDGTLPPIKVGTPKALGDGHTMGETGLNAVGHAIRYLLGKPTVGLPALRQVDPDLGDVVDQFVLEVGPYTGDTEGAAICATQGFGGYNGAVALRAANPATLADYHGDPAVFAEYLERWPEIRRERSQREFRARTTRGATLELARQHRWPGPL
jgi:3-oxoacyl-[acyl-carrier-protein] synthase II